MKILSYPLMNEADSGAEGGAAVEAATQTTVLSSVNVESKPLTELIPEKFRVFGGEDGKEFDVNASAAKLAESYTHLSKKIGTDELPPESEDGYSLDGEALGLNAEEFMADETNKGFLKKCHAAGMNNKQVQMVVEHALKDFIPSMTEGSAALSADDCLKTLKTDVWSSDRDYADNMSAANRAFSSLPESLKESADRSLGNNPEFIKVMALFGKEMREDKPAQSMSSSSQTDITEIMSSDAYKNPKNPNHAEVSAQVKAFFEKKYA